MGEALEARRTFRDEVVTRKGHLVLLGSSVNLAGIELRRPPLRNP